MKTNKSVFKYPYEKCRDVWREITRGNRIYWRTTWSAWITVIVTFLVMPSVNDFKFAPFSFDSVGVALGVFGGLFAAWSMIDAHAAARSSDEVLDTLHSFRENHAQLIDEFTRVVGQATSTVEILLPTPAYGFLFGEMERSRKLCLKLEEVCRNPDVGVSITLVARTQQDYLNQAAAMGAGCLQEFVELSGKVIDAALRPDLNNTVRFIGTDPHVRAVVADKDVGIDRSYKGVCVLSFTQRDSKSFNQFESKGFRSQRANLVQSVSDLLAVYQSVYTWKSMDVLGVRGCRKYMTERLA